mmetsp:Transcript_65420/g.175504  ORF Transcript_65420/g.175504 Transcript_65420/m.175504 type:complete len:200 (-) Transcript_65420:333-932(-)
MVLLGAFRAKTTSPYSRWTENFASLSKKTWPSANSSLTSSFRGPFATRRPSTLLSQSTRKWNASVTSSARSPPPRAACSPPTRTEPKTLVALGPSGRRTSGRARWRCTPRGTRRGSGATRRSSSSSARTPSSGSPPTPAASARRSGWTTSRRARTSTPSPTPPTTCWWARVPATRWCTGGTSRWRGPRCCRPSPSPSAS